MNDIVERLKPRPHQVDAQESAQQLAAVMAHDPRPARRRPVVAAASAAAVLGVGGAVALGVAADRDTDRAGGTGASGSVVDGECQPRLRFRGATYAAVGYLENQGPAATRVGRARISACDDEGPDEQGAHFGGTAERVPVYAFSGQPVERVVGVDFPSGYEVYVASSVPSSQAQGILEALKASGRS